MKAILYPFMILAACGLVLSMVAHGMALAGVPLPGAKLALGLHIGIFLVWLPAVLVSLQTTRFSDRKDFWKVALSGCPAWMRRACYVLFGYTVLNFIVLFTSTARDTKHRPDANSPSVVRGISGHWMVFYGAAFAILYSRIHAPALYRERKCPQGHAVSPPARFCSECGYEFPDETGNSYQK